MEEAKLDLDAPFLSVRRISIESDREKKMKKKREENSKRVTDPCLNTGNQTPVCSPGQSFDHLTEPASVPFVWEQTPGRPKNMTESDQHAESTGQETDKEQEDEAYSDVHDMASSNGYFSVNCSSSGVSEFEKNSEKSGALSGEIPEYRELMMSRFLPAAKAMALEQQRQQQRSHQNDSSAQKKKQNREAIVPEGKTLVRKHEPVSIPSHCEDMNNEEDEESHNDDDDDYSYGGSIYSRISKKGGVFLPRLCSKNSLSILNPVSSIRVKTCQDLRKAGKIIQPKHISERTMGISSREQMTPSWPSRRLSGFVSPYRYPSGRCSSLSESGFLGTQEKADIFRVNRLHRGMSKSQELRPRESMVYPNSPIAKSAEILMGRNPIPRTPSRMGRTTTDQKQEYPFTRSQSIQERGLLAEEVKKRRSNKDRTRNLLETSRMEQQSLVVAVSPPPLPKTPSESWLVRALPSVTPRSSVSSPYIPAAPAVSTKPMQETNESAKWETIVKTSYIHHDHVRYSEELVVHPSCTPKI
ncbi:PREDICTED: uncharacterized protein LOC104798428 [Tarenaya hassleriana]|uniref:uncharacterized protein LOC104798428 n=1 Tax=Tarenaya hassleriana TaxID=28532 RepID=UPI00053C2431|nr:PREDICTED: uncharacterized protein LOC104798428 [Tarenaya hassleriana]